MRSRYAAYAKRLGAYVSRSWHPDTRPADLTLGPKPVWTGLTVVAARGGGVDDDTGTVEFVATYEGGELREVGEFVRLGPDEGRRWVYVREVRTC